MRSRNAAARDVAVFFDFRGGQLPDDASVFEKSEGDFGIRERGEREIMLNVREFGFFTA